MIQLLSGIDSTASALDAERIRMDVISENIANINTTKGLDGKPYQRQQVVFESVLSAQQNSDSSGSVPQTTQIVRIARDTRPPRMVYNPSHPGRQRPGHGRHARHQHPRRDGGHDRQFARLRSQHRRGQECPQHGPARSFDRQTLIAILRTHGRSFSNKNDGWPADEQPVERRGAERHRRRPFRRRICRSSIPTLLPNPRPLLHPAVRFKILLGEFVGEVNAKQIAAGDAIAGLMSGKNVSLHQAMISMEEASVSFQMMVEVRNKLLDSYQELMRMQI